MELVFDNDNKKIQIKAEVESIDPIGRLTLIPEPSKSDDILLLTEQISAKSRLKRLRDKGNKGILGLAVSSMSLFSSADNIGKGQYDGLQKPQEKLKKK